MLMIITGYMMYRHSPKEIKSIIGYRTKRSSRNLETWKLAYNYCCKLWIKLGIVLIIPIIIVQIPFVKSGESVIGYVTIVIEIIQLADYLKHGREMEFTIEVFHC